jgi:hypothetical protein
MTRAAQYVVRAHNLDGRTDMYFGGTDYSGISLWVPIHQAAKFTSKARAKRCADDYGHCSAERLTVFGSVHA